MAADDLRQQLKVSENELEVTKAAIKRLDAEIASAQATCDYAELAYQRSERLFKANVETQADFDKQTEARKVAAYALARAQAQKNEAELTMVKQSAQIEYNRTKLAETTLTSPFNGVVIRRSRACGAVVNPGVSIMEVAATDEIWGTVWVDETAVSKLKVGQKAQIVFRSQPDQPYAATVRRLPGRAGVRRGGRLMTEANDDRPPMMAWLHAKGRELVSGWTRGSCSSAGPAPAAPEGHCGVRHQRGDENCRVWDLSPYRGDWGGLPGARWRLRDVGEAHHNDRSAGCSGVIYNNGVIDARGRIVGRPEKFVSGYSYNGYMELQQGCVRKDGSIWWPCPNG